MLNETMVERVNELKRTMSESELFTRMSSSICPEIFGMEDVK